MEGEQSLVNTWLRMYTWEWMAEVGCGNRVNQVKELDQDFFFYRKFILFLKFPNVKIEVSDREGESKPGAEVNNKLREVAGQHMDGYQMGKWRDIFKGVGF